MWVLRITIKTKYFYSSRQLFYKEDQRSYGLSYADSVREPDEFAPNFYLDDIYDGQREGGVLSGGLGLLSDGHSGHNVTLHNYGVNPCKYPCSSVT